MNNALYVKLAQAIVENKQQAAIQANNRTQEIKTYLREKVKQLRSRANTASQSQQPQMQTAAGCGGQKCAQAAGVLDKAKAGLDALVDKGRGMYNEYAPKAQRMVTQTKNDLVSRYNSLTPGQRLLLIAGGGAAGLAGGGYMLARRRRKNQEKEAEFYDMEKDAGLGAAVGKVLAAGALFGGGAAQAPNMGPQAPGGAPQAVQQVLGGGAGQNQGWFNSFDQGVKYIKAHTANPTGPSMAAPKIPAAPIANAQINAPSVKSLAGITRKLKGKKGIGLLLGALGIGGLAVGGGTYAATRRREPQGIAGYWNRMTPGQKLLASVAAAGAAGVVGGGAYALTQSGDREDA